MQDVKGKELDMGKGALWDSLRSRSRYIEMNMDSLRRKRTGSYYTDLELTDIMLHC